MRPGSSLMLARRSHRSMTVVAASLILTSPYVEFVLLPRNPPVSLRSVLSRLSEGHFAHHSFLFRIELCSSKQHGGVSLADASMYHTPVLRGEPGTAFFSCIG